MTADYGTRRYYQSFPSHPLYDVPNEIIDAARTVAKDVATWERMGPDTAQAFADAVLIKVRPWLSWVSPNDGSRATP